MANPHAPLQALAPTNWDDLPQDDLGVYINDIFAQAMIVVESIPSPSSAAPATSASSGRARSKTESAVMFTDVQRSRAVRQTQASLEAATALRKDWKEVKVNPKDNPLSVNVYKMSSKDGKGAWFARQSVHEGLSFDDWRTGLEREFAESLKVQGSPGVGNIRGIGADRHVEDRDVQDAGHLGGKAQNRSDGLRQYVIVSKPCHHSQCPPRQGIIRGQYESVEIIREVHVEPSMAKRSLSAADLAVNEESRTSADLKRGGPERVHDGRPVAVEWLMVTRSDPGGSVPRFLIEKGTPPGIVGDAGKFLTWITANSRRGWDKSNTAVEETRTSDTTTDTPLDSTNTADPATINQPNRISNNLHSFEHEDDSIPSSNGLYGIITGIFGVASSVVASGLGLGYASSEETISTIPAINVQEPDDEGSESDTSSIRSFLSALEKRLTQDEQEAKPEGRQSEDSKSTATTTNQNPSAATAAGGDKELRKLQERRRKIDEKMALMQTRLQSRSQGDKAKDEASLAKLRDKLEREASKQVAKYQKEMQRLEEKRENEAKKAEQRRRKTLEKEEKSNMALELERVRAERDIAQQHNRILEGQVRDLQAQNTRLVATLGKTGGLTSSDSVKSLGK